MPAVAPQRKSGVQTYGITQEQLKKLGFVRSPSQLDIEFLMIGATQAARDRLGGLPKEQHIKHVIAMQWPWVWKNWHDWYELCLWAWVNYESIGMTGCASAHKTFMFTLLSKIEWHAKPGKTSVILTSPTLASLRTRLWSEMRTFHARGTVDLGGNMVDSRTILQSEKGDDKFAIRAVAVDTGTVAQAVGKIQGVHPERMIMVVDEAAQTQPAVFTARANLQAGTNFFRFVAIANAVDRFDAHGRFCEPKAGWSTISVEDESWETKDGICLHFDGLKSPNVRLGEERYPHLFSHKTIANTRASFGENSLEWWMYVRGFWAPRGTRNTVLDASMIIEGQASDRAVWEGTQRKNLASLDPAFTTGGDRCVLRFARMGNFLDGLPGLELGETVQIHLVESKEYPINYQIADRVIAECTQRNVQPPDFAMDATAASGLRDIIWQRWSASIVPVQFGGLATSEPVSAADPREGTKVYGNRVTQLWFSVQKLIVAGRIRGLDPDTAKEFCSRQYDLKGEKTVVEPKKDMKARTGESPDLADPVTLLVHLYLLAYGMPMSSMGNPASSAEWEALVKRFSIATDYRS